jgi:hypothetical protein
MAIAKDINRLMHVIEFKFEPTVVSRITHNYLADV